MAKKSFQTILDRAARRKGDEKTLMALMPQVADATSLQRLTDAQVLATMTRCVFQAGFAWKVIDQKWRGFVEAFYGFNPEALVLLSPDDLERLAQDRRIVRNPQKIHTVPQNAQWINQITREHGSFGAFLSQWPTENLIGLFDTFKRQGARLGGNTGQRVIRLLGKDTFMLSGDVVTALKDFGLDVANKPSSKKELLCIQDTFNAWHKETGLPYAHLSKILAYSVGENYDPEFIQQEMGRYDRQ